MDDKKLFCLINEPWIQVITNDMLPKEVSLMDVLVNAHLYKQLAGDTPTQNAAIYRFLLALVNTIFYRYDIHGNLDEICEDSYSDPEDVLSRWKEYSDNKHFPENAIKQYLSLYEERFWLFHSKTPFYQVPELDSFTDYNGISCFIGNIKESNNKDTKHHFSLSEGINLEECSFAEAARWLIYLNAYSVNVKKNSTKLIGDLGRIGFIMANGNNLFETLMLNLCALRDGSELWGKPSPEWENPPCPKNKREIPIPDNLPALYTMQSRRIVLKKSETSVYGFKISGGDYFDLNNFTGEQMTIWKSQIDPETNTRKDIPKIHNPEIFSWREFPSIITGQYKSESNRKPGLILWIEKLLENDLLDKSQYITFQTIGLTYDKMKYKYDEIVNDSLSISAGLLTDLGADWNTRITDEVNKCTSISFHLKNLCTDINTLLFGKNSGKNTEETLIREFFYQIDLSFREWLLSIDPSQHNYDEKQQELERIAFNSVRLIAEKYISSLGPGIYRTGKLNSRDTSVIEIYNSFIKNISKTYDKRSVITQQKGE